MVTAESNRASRIIRRTARILASIACLFFAFIVIRDTITSPSGSYFALDTPYLILVLLAIVLGLLLAWWDDLPASTFMATLSAVIGTMANFNWWLLLGIPFLVAGVLFITAWLFEIIHRRGLKGARPV